MRYSTARLTAAASAFTLAVIMSPAPASAQGLTDDQDDDYLADDDDEIFPDGTIVVTARRRAETLQDVPVAVSAFTDEDLSTGQLDTLTDLPGAVPNLNVSFITASSTAIIFLRGAGQDDTNPPSEQPITVYLDGVPYLKAPGAVFDLINLESLEVLRGPQGTLYGRNATGGAIKLRTRRPDLDAPRVLARATLGTFDRIDVAGSFSCPIGDSFAFGADFVSRSDEGYIRDAFGGGRGDRPERYNATDRQTIRLSGVWQPTPDLSVYLAGDYTDEDSGPFTSTPALTSRAADNFANGDFVDTPDLFGSPYLAAPTLFAQSEYGGYGVTLNAEYDLGAASVELIGGYRGFEQGQAFDTDGGPSRGVFFEPFVRSGNAFDFVRDWEHDAYTIELKANSTGSGPLSYVAGVFYLNERNVATSVLGRYTDPASIASPSATAQDQDQTTNSLAVFGEVSFRPIDWLELTAGLRYTHDDKKLTVTQRGAFGLPLFFGRFFPAFGPVTAEAEFDKFTPRGIVKVDLSDDVSIYGSYSQGFQAGAFQGFQLTAANAVVPINETVVHSYEAGLRSQFFDRRLTVNVTGFIADYDDLPTTQFTSASGFLEARTFDAQIRGLEFDIAATPLPGLDLNATFGITDTETPTDMPDVIAAPLVPGKTENDLKYVSPFSGRFQAQYTADLPGTLGSVRMTGNVTRQGEFFTSTVNNPFAYEDGYTLIGAQVDYLTQDENWTVGAGVRNLTDEVYELRSSADGGGSRTYGPPRTFYVTVQFTY